MINKEYRQRTYRLTVLVFLALSSFLNGQDLFAQATDIQLSGKVIDADSLSPIASVFIYVSGQERGAG